MNGTATVAGSYTWQTELPALTVAKVMNGYTVSRGVSVWVAKDAAQLHKVLSDLLDPVPGSKDYVKRVGYESGGAFVVPAKAKT